MKPALLPALLTCCTMAAAADTSAAPFTRVCNSGAAAGSATCRAQAALGDAPTAWGCTRDNATGLLWELKTADGSLRDRDKTYTNFSTDYDPSKTLGGATDAAGYVAAVNARGLCGANDWRLPTRAELFGIAVHRVSAALDTAWFPNPPAPGGAAKSVYWSGSALAGKPSNAWGVDFGDGVAGDDNRSIYYALRLVRGAQPAAAASASADGQEVHDARTGLVWRRCAEGASWTGSTCAGTAVLLDWSAAAKRASEQAASARTAWRLPDVKELASIIDDGKAGPAIDPALFPATPAVRFWTSTPSAGDAAHLWTVQFGQGHVGNHGYRGDKHALRLVRSTR